MVGQEASQPLGGFSVEQEAPAQRSGQSHIVQQVIFNQGSVVINNGTHHPQQQQHAHNPSLATHSAHYQVPSQPHPPPQSSLSAGTARSNPAQGHAKTKSTSFVVGQGGLILAPAHKPSQNSDPSGQ